MKKLLVLFSVAALVVSATEVSAQLRIGGKALNAGKLVQAASDVATAISLTDADIARLSH